MGQYPKESTSISCLGQRHHPLLSLYPSASAAARRHQYGQYPRQSPTVWNTIRTPQHTSDGEQVPDTFENLQIHLSARFDLEDSSSYGPNHTPLHSELIQYQHPSALPGSGQPHSQPSAIRADRSNHLQHTPVYSTHCLGPSELANQAQTLLHPNAGYPQESYLMATMVDRPSSTPANEPDHFGLHHLESFNREAAPKQQSVGPDGGIYAPSSHPESPSMGMQQTMHNNTPDPFLGHPHDGGYPDMQSPEGLGIQLDSWGQQQQQSLVYSRDATPSLPSNGVKEESSSPVTPQTPSIRTRSGRAVCRATPPQVLRSNNLGARVSKSPRTPKSRSKSSGTKAPSIDKPLSELTKHYGDTVPVRDMEAWVNRPDEDRYIEAAKRNGNIARPMNSFMLYRSAYSERTKKWCEQNNHQVVSAVSGESWPLEPQFVRDFYNNLAKIERDNHARAHPDYKFSPSKNGPASRRKKADLSDDEESVASGEVGDGDSEWRPRGTRRTRQSRETMSPSPYANGFDNAYAANTGYQSQGWDLRHAESSHFPGAVSTPGPYQMPYFQQGPTSHPREQYYYQQGQVNGHQEYVGMPVPTSHANGHAIHVDGHGNSYYVDVVSPYGHPAYPAMQMQQQMRPHECQTRDQYQPPLHDYEHSHAHAIEQLQRQEQVDPSLLALNNGTDEHGEGNNVDPFLGNPYPSLDAWDAQGRGGANGHAEVDRGLY